MKRLIAAAVLFAVVIMLSVCARSVTENSYNRAADLLTKSRICYGKGDKKTAVGLTAELKDSWKNSYKYLAAFAEHDTLDEIEASITRAHSFAAAGNDAFFSECDMLKLLLERMLEEESPTLTSFF